MCVRARASGASERMKGERERESKVKEVEGGKQNSEKTAPSGNQRQATISKCDTDYHQGGSAHSALKDPLSIAHHVEATPLPARAIVVVVVLGRSRAVLVACLPIAAGQQPHRPTLQQRACSRAVLITCRPLLRGGSHDRHPVRSSRSRGRASAVSCHRFSVSEPSVK
jgi:hypothetical protein